MRDIHGDLQERASKVEQLIKAEHAQFQTRVTELQREQHSSTENLRAELRAIKKLVEVATWQNDIRAALLGAISVAGVAELSIRKSIKPNISTAPAALH